MNQGLPYLEHLTDADLALLLETGGAGDDPARLRSRLRGEPEVVEDLLAAPELYERLVAVPHDRAFDVPASPFLTFSVLVHRIAAELGETDFVQEWTGPRQRLPVFDVEPLRAFLQDPANRFYLARLLASFTRVASGTFWVRTSRGAKRRRWSELDLVQLALLAEEAPGPQRPALYRRMGDVALFLTGVFPDHTARRALTTVEIERLARAAGMTAGETLDADREAGTGWGTIGVVEDLGRRWYRRSEEAVRRLGWAAPRVAEQMSSQFRPARRTLNVLTDRYLYAFDTDWFPPPAA